MYYVVRGRTVCVPLWYVKGSWWIQGGREILSVPLLGLMSIQGETEFLRGLINDADEGNRFKEGHGLQTGQQLMVLSFPDDVVHVCRRFSAPPCTSTCCIYDRYTRHFLTTCIEAAVVKNSFKEVGGNRSD